MSKSAYESPALVDLGAVEDLTLATVNYKAAVPGIDVTYNKKKDVIKIKIGHAGYKSISQVVPRTNLVRLRTDDLSWRDVEDDVVILDETTWKYVHLNASASVLWRELAAGETTEDHLVAHLAETFPSAPDAAADVAAFLSDLRGRGYLDA